MKKKYLYILAGLLLVATTFSIIELTKASPAAPNPGHTAAQIEPGSEGEVLKTTGGNVAWGSAPPPTSLNAVAIPTGQTGSYTWDKNAIRVCQFGTCCPPWKDCDADTYNYQAATDCDEGQATSYVGSTFQSTIQNGIDEDCSGVVDELVIGASVVQFGSNAACGFENNGIYIYANASLGATFCNDVCITSASCNRDCDKWTSSTVNNSGTGTCVVCNGIPWCDSRGSASLGRSISRCSCHTRGYK